MKRDEKEGKVTCGENSRLVFSLKHPYPLGLLRLLSLRCTVGLLKPGDEENWRFWIG